MVSVSRTCGFHLEPENTRRELKRADLRALCVSGAFYRVSYLSLPGQSSRVPCPTSSRSKEFLLHNRSGVRVPGSSHGHVCTVLVSLCTPSALIPRRLSAGSCNIDTMLLAVMVPRTGRLTYRVVSSVAGIFGPHKGHHSRRLKAPCLCLSKPPRPDHMMHEHSSR